MTPRMGIGAIVALAATLLLVVAVRATFAGYPSFEPVLFAELYIWAFGICAFLLILIPSVRRARGEFVLLLFIGALAGAVIFHLLAPTIGEPNYCGYVGDYPQIIDLRTPPKVFRCTTVPFEVAGWFVGWGVVLWIVTKRKR